MSVTSTANGPGFGLYGCTFVLHRCCASRAQLQGINGWIISTSNYTPPRLVCQVEYQSLQPLLYRTILCIRLQTHYFHGMGKRVSVLSRRERPHDEPCGAGFPRG